MHVYVK